ncbi:S1 RNA-binding domain-containing protein [Patescibacteria group bacterium]|nr:S1 RNA-binding domain-containing protein [Patescibacteria group bacterium]
MIKKDLPRQAADGEQKTKEPETKKTAKKTGFMEEMLSRKESEMKMPEKDDLIEGVVIDIGKQALYLDLGPVGAGVIYGRELEDGIGTLKTLKIGDKIKATVITVFWDRGVFF